MGEPNISKLRLITLKHDRTYAIFDENGDIAAENGVQGVYIDDMRYHSALTLTVGDKKPESVSAQLTPGNEELIVRLTNPEIKDAKGRTIPANTIHLERRITVCDGLVHQAIAVSNRGRDPVVLPLTFRFSSDFNDMFTVRGMDADTPGAIRQVRLADEFCRVIWDYRTIDDKTLSGNVFFASEPKPRLMSIDSAAYRLGLAPNQTANLFIEFGNSKENAVGPARKTYDDALYTIRKERGDFLQGGIRISFSNPRLQKWFDCSREDLALLINHYAGGPYPCAGLPWFATPFGRDGIITALQMTWADPRIAKGVLKYLSATQATELIPAKDAEPGKIMHETRQDEMSRLGIVPFSKYYGGVDTTLLYVMLAGEYLDRTGDRALIDEIWPNIEAALQWAEDYAEDVNYPAVAEKDGFLVYQRKQESGLENQVWKDSADSIFYEDGGTGVKFPRAVCEVQGYAYAAWRTGARLAAAKGMTELAAHYAAKADNLQARFNKKFWDEEKGFYVLALDGDKKPCRVKASNMGELLFTGIVPPERAEKIIATIMDESFFNGFGIRTVAEGEINYNPLAYHRGPVWPHHTAMIGRGIGEAGDSASALKLMEGMLDAAEFYNWRLPELFAGYRREHGLGPAHYTHACSPQAWAAAVPFQMLQAILSLKIDAARNMVELDSNKWPAKWGALTVENLAVGDKTASFTIDNGGITLLPATDKGVSVAIFNSSVGKKHDRPGEKKLPAFPAVSLEP